MTDAAKELFDPDAHEILEGIKDPKVKAPTAGTLAQMGGRQRERERLGIGQDEKEIKRDEHGVLVNGPTGRRFIPFEKPVAPPASPQNPPGKTTTASQK